MSIMDMPQVMKEFISNANNNEKQHNVNVLVKNLQILSAADDLSVFDTGSFVAAEFYSLLYDLLNNPETDSDLVWAIIKVLQVAVRNTTTSSALVQSYHFIYPLTTILDAQFTTDKRLALLNLIQELTYGLVICWQEAHLPKLIAILIDIIKSNQNELIPAALGVLVNLCHKNKPAVYIVLNSVDVKVLLRTVLKLQRENTETSVQVCKLLMIFDHLSSQVPDEEILSFVRVSFLRLNKAFSCGNTFLMRHIVDFFHDAKESEHGKKILLQYPKYEQELDNIINLLNENVESNNWQCVLQIVRFLQELIDFELSSITPLFTKLIQCLMPWVKVDGVTPVVLGFISTMVHQSRNQNYEVYEEMCSGLEKHLRMLCEMLHDKCQNLSTTSKSPDSLRSLIRLLRELATNSTLTSEISSEVDKEILKNLFLPLMSPSNDVVILQPASVLYIEALSFISQVSLENKEWLFLYIDLLQKKQVIKALAHALYSGPCDVKKQILFLTGTPSFSKECLTTLSRCLTDLNQLFNVDSVLQTNQLSDKVACYPQTLQDVSIPMTKSQNESLNCVIEKLQNLLENNQIADVSLAGVIELYNYKLTEMRRGERSLLSSLAVGDNHRTKLSHRVAQLSTETSRLHQMLHSCHQTLEGSQVEVTQLRVQLQSAQESASTSHRKLKQLKLDAQTKNAELNEEILRLKKLVKELTTKCEELQLNVASLEKHKSELETKLGSCEELITEKDVLISNKTTQIKTLEQEVINKKCYVKELEKSLKAKEKEITSQQNQLMELERMRKVIFELTGGKN